MQIDYQLFDLHIIVTVEYDMGHNYITSYPYIPLKNNTNNLVIIVIE